LRVHPVQERIARSAAQNRARGALVLFAAARQQRGMRSAE